MALTARERALAAAWVATTSSLEDVVSLSPEMQVHTDKLIATIGEAMLEFLGPEDMLEIALLKVALK